MAQYTYYQEVQSEEHMLYAKEIGEFYGLSSQKVASMIQKYVDSNNIELPKLFYNTRNGLKRVYPEYIWKAALGVHH